MKKLCIMLLVLALTFGLVACGTKPAKKPQAEAPTQATEDGQGDVTPTEPTEPTDPTDPTEPTKPTEPTDPTVPVVPDPVPTPTPGGNGGNGGNTGSTTPSEPEEPVDPNVYTGTYSGNDAEIDLNEGKNTFSSILREEVDAETLEALGLSGTVTIVERINICFPNVALDDDQVTMSGLANKVTSTLALEGTAAAGYKTLVLATLENLYEEGEMSQEDYELYKALFSGEEREMDAIDSEVTLVAKLVKSNQTFQLLSIDVLSEDGDSSSSTFEYKNGVLYKESRLDAFDWGASYEVFTYYPDGKTTHVYESYNAKQEGDEYIPGNLSYRQECYESGELKKETYYYEDGTVSSEYEYNEYGVCTRDASYYENGNLDSEWTYNDEGYELTYKQYDEEGNLTYSRDSEFDGDERIVREYDDQGRLSTVTYYEFNGTDYEYIKSVEYSYWDSGTIMEYEYDRNGLRKETCKLYTEDTKEYLYTWSWTYGDEDVLTLTDDEDTFNENGDPVKEFTHFDDIENSCPDVDLYTYNEKGDLIRQACYDSYGYCTSYTAYEYEYGPDGKPVSAICRNEYDEILYTRQYHDDGSYTDTYTYENGNPEVTYRIFPNGEKIITHYNEDGTIWRIFHLKTDGTSTETTYYSDGTYSILYWDEDIQIKTEYYDENDKLNLLQEYFEDKSVSTYYNDDGSVWCIDEYDADGNLVKSTYYNDDGSVWCIDEYDADGNLVKSTYYHDDRSYYIDFYDTDGNLTATENYDADGGFLSRTEYDEDGNPI